MKGGGYLKMMKGGKTTMMKNIDKDKNTYVQMKEQCLSFAYALKSPLTTTNLSSHNKPILKHHLHFISSKRATQQPNCFSKGTCLPSPNNLINAQSKKGKKQEETK